MVFFTICNVALVCSLVFDAHILQSQRQVTILHLTVRQHRPVHKRWVLVTWSDVVPVSDKVYTFLEVTSGPLDSIDGFVAGSPTSQKDSFTMFS